MVFDAERIKDGTYTFENLDKSGLDSTEFRNYITQNAAVIDYDMEFNGEHRFVMFKRVITIAVVKKSWFSRLIAKLPKFKVKFL